MLDQCIITVPNGPLVKPEIFTEKYFEIDGWLQFHAVRQSQHRVRRHDGYVHTGKWSFDLFGDRVLRFRTKHIGSSKEPFRQVIDQIELNLAKIAHGHNAIPIRHEREFCGLLILVRHILGRVLVDPSKASSLIPGLVRRSKTHWSKIEIGMHVADPGHLIHRQMRRMRSTRIRKTETLENTVRLKGTHALMRVYNKPSELVAKKHGKANLRPSTADPVTRLEVELIKTKAASLLPLEDGTPPLVRKEDDKEFLEGFTLGHLKRTHRDYFSDLKAVYAAKRKPREGERSGMAAVLAAVHLTTEKPVEELLDLWLEVGMRRGQAPKTEAGERKAKEREQRARRDLRARIERFLEESSTLDADELLSDANYRNQPIVGIEQRYGVGKMVSSHYGLETIWEVAHDPRADRQISEVYMERNPKTFTPVTELAWWS